VKNDFVKTCEVYLAQLKINLTFEEIIKMSQYKFKKLVKEKTREAGFFYLIEEKYRQPKMCDIEYKSLEIQEYLMEENRNTEISKVIFK
jgi:hypothetical protein